MGGKEIFKIFDVLSVECILGVEKLEVISEGTSEEYKLYVTDEG